MGEEGEGDGKGVDGAGSTGIQSCGSGERLEWEV